MSIKSNIPQIVILRTHVEARFGKRLIVHADFIALVSAIEEELRQHISESTLERVWGYSTRGYDTVSRRTLDVLSLYADGCDWHDFCLRLARNSECESEMFDAEFVSSSDLQEGDRVRIGWLPDRLCEVRYLGDNRFVAEECHNSKLAEGDMFVCAQFMLGKELVMRDYTPKGGSTASAKHYTVGMRHGLTTLSIIRVTHH